MEDLLQFLKLSYLIVVLDSGKRAIGKFSDEIGDGHLDKKNGIIDGCLTDLKILDSVESLIEFIDDHAQLEEKQCKQS